MENNEESFGDYMKKLDEMKTKGKEQQYVYFTVSETGKDNYLFLIFCDLEEHPEWELVQVLQRVEMVRTDNKIQTLNDNGVGGVAAVQIFTPMYRTKKENMNKLPKEVTKYLDQFKQERLRVKRN